MIHDSLPGFSLATALFLTFFFTESVGAGNNPAPDSDQSDSTGPVKENKGNVFQSLFKKEYYYRRGKAFIDTATGELVIPFDSVGASQRKKAVSADDREPDLLHSLTKSDIVEIMTQRTSYFIPGLLYRKFKLNDPNVYNKKEELFFENKISPFFTMSAQSIWGKKLKEGSFGKHSFDYLIEPWVLSLQIPVTVRMYKAVSKPVWNPSYEIEPMIHWAPKNVNKPVLSNMTVSWGPLVHHSNGQEQPLWDSAGALPYNEHYGSFSTWYSLLGLQLYYQWAETLLGGNVWWEHHYKNSFEYPLSSLNYGREKLRIDLLFVWASKSWEMWQRLFAYSHAPEWKFALMVRHENLDKNSHPYLKDGDIPNSVKDPGATYKRNIFPIKFTVVFRPGFLDYWGIYFEYYRGSDYYNASFIRNISYFRWGISFDKSPYYKEARM